MLSLDPVISHAAAKRRGVKPGNPNGATVFPRAGKGKVDAAAKVAPLTRERDQDLRPVIEYIQQAGITSVRGIARGLSTRGMLTPRAGSGMLPVWRGCWAGWKRHAVAREGPPGSPQQPVSDGPLELDQRDRSKP